MKTEQSYFVEHTDTFGGEANYCWVNRFKVSAPSARAALTKVKKELWHRCPRAKVSDYGDQLRADIIGSPECLFVSEWDYFHDENPYTNIKYIA